MFFQSAALHSIDPIFDYTALPCAISFLNALTFDSLQHSEAFHVQQIKLKKNRNTYLDA